MNAADEARSCSGQKSRWTLHLENANALNSDASDYSAVEYIEAIVYKQRKWIFLPVTYKENSKYLYLGIADNAVCCYIDIYVTELFIFILLSF